MRYIKHILLLLLVVTLSGCKETPILEKLDTPENLRFEDILRWDEVDDATEYHVYINDDEVNFITTDNYYVISEQGEYSIYVVAYADGYEASEKSYTFELSLIYQNEITPTYTLVGNELNWEDLDNAVSYNVYIDGVKMISSESHIGLTDPGIHEVSIQAVYPVGQSNVSTPELIQYNIVDASLVQFQYSTESTVDILLLDKIFDNNLYILDSEGNIVDKHLVITTVDGQNSIKSSYIKSFDDETVSFFIVSEGYKVPIEITVSNRTTPYIISSTIIKTSGEEDFNLQFELFDGVLYSINGTAQDTVPWTIEDGLVTIEQEFLSIKFGLSSAYPAEFALSYVINIGDDSVIGYLYFTQTITE